MVDNERKKKLMETLKTFNKEHKEEVFTLGNEIEELPVIASGVEKFDNFIGGGFKNGGHTIVFGPYSVGKTALILQTIANAQKNDKLVCYVNTEKPIEPNRFKFFGINLDDLVYVEAPSNAEQALEAMRRLCKDKVIDLFVIDSIQGLCPKSIQEESSGKERSLEKKNVASLPLVLSNFYNVVNAYVFKSKASVIWIGQQRQKGIGSYYTYMGLSGGNAQEFYAFQIIQLRNDQKSNAPVNKIKEWWKDPEDKIRYRTKTEPCGFSVVFKLTKTNSSKSMKENSELTLPFLYDKGFVSEIVESEDIPVEIDPLATDEQRKIIEEYLIEKKPEDAEKLGLIKPVENVTKEDLVQICTESELPTEEIREGHVEEAVQKIAEVNFSEDKPKKKRGRPSKK